MSNVTQTRVFIPNIQLFTSYKKTLKKFDNNDWIVIQLYHVYCQNSIYLPLLQTMHTDNIDRVSIIFMI